MDTSTVKRVTDLHRALRLKAPASDRSVSEIVSEAIRLCLAENAADLAVFEERKDEATEAFDDFAERLERSCQI
jgi:hypothetical protein